MLMMVVFTIMSSYSKSLFPDSETVKSEVELGVEGIQRLCSTSMWDNWMFRDITFDKESNTVRMDIQFNSWSEDEEESSTQVTEADDLKHMEWIVSNFKNAYEDLIENPRVMCDGDFMLYLSVGSLLKQMDNDGTILCITILESDIISR